MVRVPTSVLRGLVFNVALLGIVGFTAVRWCQALCGRRVYARCSVPPTLWKSPRAVTQLLCAVLLVACPAAALAFVEHGIEFWDNVAQLALFFLHALVVTPLLAWQVPPGIWVQTWWFVALIVDVARVMNAAETKSLPLVTISLARGGFGLLFLTLGFLPHMGPFPDSTIAPAREASGSSSATTRAAIGSTSRNQSRDGDQNPTNGADAGLSSAVVTRPSSGEDAVPVVRFEGIKSLPIPTLWILRFFTGLFRTLGILLLFPRVSGDPFHQLASWTWVQLSMGLLIAQALTWMGAIYTIGMARAVSSREAGLSARARSDMLSRLWQLGSGWVLSSLTLGGPGPALTLLLWCIGMDQGWATEVRPLLILLPAIIQAALVATAWLCLSCLVPYYDEVELPLWVVSVAAGVTGAVVLVAVPLFWLFPLQPSALGSDSVAQAWWYAATPTAVLLVGVGVALLAIDRVLSTTPGRWRPLRFVPIVPLGFLATVILSAMNVSAGWKPTVAKTHDEGPFEAEILFSPALGGQAIMCLHDGILSVIAIFAVLCGCRPAPTSTPSRAIAANEENAVTDPDDCDWVLWANLDHPMAFTMDDVNALATQAGWTTNGSRRWSAVPGDRGDPATRQSRSTTGSGWERGGEGGLRRAAEPLLANGLPQPPPVARARKGIRRQRRRRYESTDSDRAKGHIQYPRGSGDVDDRGDFQHGSPHGRYEPPQPVHLPPTAAASPAPETGDGDALPPSVGPAIPGPAGHSANHVPSEEEDRGMLDLLEEPGPDDSASALQRPPPRAMLSPQEAPPTAAGGAASPAAVAARRGGAGAGATPQASQVELANGERSQGNREALPAGWVVREWLPQLGLPQYGPAFSREGIRPSHVVRLSEQELQTRLGMRDRMHRQSFLAGVRFLDECAWDWDGEVAELRRLRWRPRPLLPDHLPAWTNEHVIQWLQITIPLDPASHARQIARLQQSGLHGAFLFAQRPFSGDLVLAGFGFNRATAKPRLQERVDGALVELESLGAAHVLASVEEGEKSHGSGDGDEARNLEDKNGGTASGKKRKGSHRKMDNGGPV